MRNVLSFCCRCRCRRQKMQKMKWAPASIETIEQCQRQERLSVNFSLEAMHKRNDVSNDCLATGCCCFCWCHCCLCCCLITINKAVKVVYFHFSLSVCQLPLLGFHSSKFLFSLSISFVIVELLLAGYMLYGRMIFDARFRVTIRCSFFFLFFFLFSLSVVSNANVTELYFERTFSLVRSLHSHQRCWKFCEFKSSFIVAFGKFDAFHLGREQMNANYEPSEKEKKKKKWATNNWHHCRCIKIWWTSAISHESKRRNQNNSLFKSETFAIAACHRCCNGKVNTKLS